jgi:hypothetical protein
MTSSMKRTIGSGVFTLIYNNARMLSPPVRLLLKREKKIEKKKEKGKKREKKRREGKRRKRRKRKKRERAG